MKSATMTLELTGTRPMLMHSSRLADPLDPVTRQLARLTSKRLKTEADHAEIMRIEWYGGLWLNDGKPCIPPQALEATFREAAKTLRRGPQARAGMLIKDPAMLVYDGPSDIDQLWADERFRLRLPVKIGNAMTMRTRARFADWSVRFDVTYVPSLLNKSEVFELFERAGEEKAVGDYRPQYGTFAVEKIE